MRDSVEANDIFVVVVDPDVIAEYTPESYEAGEWTPLYYIADCYIKPEDNFDIGAAGAVYPDFKDMAVQSWNDGIRYDGFYITKTKKWGYLLNAVQPVVDNGKTVAMICVEIPMKTLQSNLSQFVLRTSIITAVIMVICMLLAIILITRTVISPVKLIAEEADKFVGNNTQISDKLQNIKTGDEIQTLSESLLKMETDINDYIDNLQKVTAEKERIGAELNVATQIQADMLPRIFPPFPERNEFDLYATMDPAKEVGGDFYDFFFVDKNKLAIVMADVSGKGVPAALFMVVAKTLIKNLAITGMRVDEVLQTANESLCEGNGQEMFVTAWLGIIDLELGMLSYADAGHENPYIIHDDGSIEMILPSRKKLPLAAMETTVYPVNELRLKQNDMLFLYTDGVPEATNKSDELYTVERLERVLRRNYKDDPEELLVHVRKNVDAFVKGAPQFDDLTMLAVRIKGLA
jgi:sigma-B regulation protein RsbU (phosphoserine phosphatase)